ncbi:hypothetical protein H849_15187 [Prescottella equi NBRC 101255 = C 7]|nr:hypothetical protein H849_15187 [Prescottella equi NBRC 101255 = C 7]
MRVGGRGVGGVGARDHRWRSVGTHSRAYRFGLGEYRMCRNETEMYVTSVRKHQALFGSEVRV